MDSNSFISAITGLPVLDETTLTDEQKADLKIYYKMIEKLHKSYADRAQAIYDAILEQQ